MLLEYTQIVVITPKLCLRRKEGNKRKDRERKERDTHTEKEKKRQNRQIGR